MSTDSNTVGSGGDDGGGGNALPVQCVVSTFVRPADDRGCISDQQRNDFIPMTVCYSKASNSLVYIERGEWAVRVYLPATPEMRRSMRDGLIRAAPSLSVVLPLIDLIVSYAGNDGTCAHTKLSHPTRLCFTPHVPLCFV